MASKRFQVYKCELCGNIIEVLHGDGAHPVCCGQAMTLLEEKTADAKTEKHVPVIEKTGNGFKVTVGSTLHPMADDHYIEWIEIIVDGKSYREYLKPGAQPAAFFPVQGKSVTAREYCNKHGLWKATLD